MTDNIKLPPLPERFDCTNGSAQWCYGCYTMTRDDLGDYVLAEDYDALRNASEALQAENERLREDAERYRWLRDREIPEWLDLWHQNPDRIDAAIDQARGKNVPDQQADKVRELMLEACRLRDKHSAAGYMDASYQVSDECIVDGILSKDQAKKEANQ